MQTTTSAHKIMTAASEGGPEWVTFESDDLYVRALVRGRRQFFIFSEAQAASVWESDARQEDPATRFVWFEAEVQQELVDGEMVDTYTDWLNAGHDHGKIFNASEGTAAEALAAARAWVTA